jgi:hypothetical protein
MYYRLTQRIKKVELFLSTQKIDILFVTEMNFTEQNSVNVPNYITYVTNHTDGTAHSGSAITVRKDVEDHELAKFETDHIQATNISIEDWDGNLTISAINCPPRHAIKKEQYITFINSLRHRFLVGGDFNANPQYWSSRLINPKRRELYQTTQEKQLEILSTGEPTYCPSSRTMALRSIQPLPQMSARNRSGGVKGGRHVRQATSPQSMSRLS